MNTCSKIKSQAAFSLIEVMVALTIFSFVIASAFVAISRGYELVSEARHYTRASQILQSEIELLRTLPWATFSGLDSDTLSGYFETEIQAQFGAGVYDGEVDITPIGTDFVTIDVSVTWTDSNEREKTVTYTTAFSRGGVNDYYIN